MTTTAIVAEPISMPQNRPRGKAHGHFLPLDGLRGLAILLVIVHHLNRMQPGGRIDNLFRALADAGWVGVDIFFVLSGFLITSILFDSKPGPSTTSGRYFLNFYARRVLRIFPLYYAFLLLFFVIVPHLAPHTSNEFGKVPGHPSLYLLYWANYSVIYFDRLIHPALSVAWSLAIEEQFYLIWPAVVLLCSRRTLMVICGAIISAALVCRTVMVLRGSGWIAVYYASQARMDSLAFGALCALAVRGDTAWLARVARSAIIAGGVGLVAVMAQQRTMHWVGGLGQTMGYTVVGVLSTTLLLAALRASPGQMLYRWLASTPMRFFGRYSYAMYLVHLPVATYVSLHIFNPQRATRLLGSQVPAQWLFYLISGGITVALAMLSWNLLERHMLRLKRFFPEGSATRGPRPELHVVPAPVGE